jgi:hypothetical protein
MIRSDDLLDRNDECCYERPVNTHRLSAQRRIFGQRVSQGDDNDRRPTYQGLRPIQ